MGKTLLRILGVSGLNLRPRVNDSYCCQQTLALRIRRRPVPSTYILVHYSILILSLIATITGAVESVFSYSKGEAVNCEATFYVVSVSCRASSMSNIGISHTLEGQIYLLIVLLKRDTMQ
jgi:hypothetical protein